MKSGIRVHGRDLFHKADNIWFTCCALHNWLLDVDGLGAQWAEGVQGDWEGSWGLHDSSDAARFGVSRDADLSGFGGIDAVDGTDLEEPGSTPARTVRHMDQFVFREKLINHFNCKWRRHEVTWPSRNGASVWQPPESLIAHAATFS